MSLLSPVQRNSDQYLDVDEDVNSGRYMDTMFQAAMWGNPIVHSLENVVLDDASHRGPQMSLDDANQQGEQYGLRFSEPPTRAQFDMEAAHKVRERNLDAILSRSPGTATSIAGFFAGLAGAALDPINDSVGLLPGIGEANEARIVAMAWGSRTAGRAASGAASGAIGMAALTPLNYALAQPWQDQYGWSEALHDVEMGAFLGAGFHAVPPLLAHGFQYGHGQLANLHEVAKDLYSRKTPEAPDVEAAAAAGPATPPRAGAAKFETAPAAEPERPLDLRKVKQTAGETPYAVDALEPEVREKLMEAAIRGVGNDKFPLMDELLKLYPEGEERLMTSSRYPSQVRLRNPFTAESFYDLSQRPARMIESMLQRQVRGAEGSKTQALFDRYQDANPELKDTKFEQLPAAEYDRNRDHMRETSGVGVPAAQRAYYDAERNAIVASDDATLGALHHQIQGALDGKQGFEGEEAGGYRFSRDNFQDAKTLRKASILAEGGVRRGAPDPRDQLKTFSESPDLATTPADAVNSQRLADTVNADKDKGLATLMDEEEQAARETVQHLKVALGRDLGFAEKALSDEERALAEPKAQIEAVESELKQTVAELPEGDPIQQNIIAIMAYPHIIDAIYEDRIPFEVGAHLGRMVEAGEEHPRILSRIEAEAKDDIARANAIIDEEAALLAKAQEETLAAEGLAQDEAQPAQEKPIELPVHDTGAPDEAALNRIEENIVREEQAELKATPRTKKLASPSEENLFNENAAWRARIESLDAFRGGQEDTQELTRPRDPSEAGRPETSLGQARPTDAHEGRLAPESSDGGAASYGTKARAVELGVHAFHRMTTPDGSMEVNAVPRIVERASLRFATGAFRGRGKATTSATNIAAGLEPEQLGKSHVSDAGAPVVTKDGLIVSGNSRTRAIGLAYEWAAKGDRSQAEPYLFSLGREAAGFKEPVLVHELADDLSNEDLISFAERSNRPRIEPTEASARVERDAALVGADIMRTYQGGKLTLKRNKSFTDSFLREVSQNPEAEGLRDADGALTKPGAKRIDAVLMAHAYGDPVTLAALQDSPYRQLARMVGAYRDVAADFIRLKNYISAGFADPAMDISPHMIEAAKIVHRYLHEGKSPVEWLTDMDPLDRRDPLVEQLVRSFYDDSGKPLDRDVFSGILRAYVKEATKGRPLLTQGVSNAANEELSAGAEGVRGGAAERGAAEPGQPAAQPGEPHGANAADHTGAGGERGAVHVAAAHERVAGRGEPVGAGTVEGQNERGASLNGEPKQEEPAIKLDLSRPVNKAVTDFLGAAGDREAFLKVYNRIAETGGFSREDVKRTYYAITGDLPGKQRLETMLKGIEGKFKELSLKPDIVQAVREDVLGRLAGVQKSLPKKEVVGTSEFAAGAAQRLRDASDMATWDDVVKSLKTAKKMSKPELLSLAGELLGEKPDAKLTKDAIWEKIGALRPEPKPASERPLHEMTDEEIDALPERAEEAAKPQAFSAENRDRLFDMLDEGKQVKGVLQLAKDMKVSADEASALIDYMENYGWLKYTEAGDIRRVGAQQRPVRPQRGEGQTMLSLRENRPFEFTNLTRAEFAERLAKDPHALDALAKSDPMVAHSYDPEIAERLMAIDRALGRRFAISDEDGKVGNERSKKTVRASEGDVAGERQGGDARHVTSSGVSLDPGGAGLFEAGGLKGLVIRKRIDPKDDRGVPRESRIYSLNDAAGKQVAQMDVRRAFGGRGYIFDVEAPRGVGTALYDAVEQHMGVKLRPSNMLTEAGYRFWKKRDPEAVKWHQLLSEDSQDEGYYISPRLLHHEMEKGLASREGERLWNNLPAEAKRAAENPDTMFALRERPLQIPHPDPYREASAVKVREMVEDTAARVLPRGVLFRFMDSLRDPRAMYASGIWDPHERLVQIADGLRNPLKVLYDEANHVFRALGGYTDSEWKMLMKASKEKGWVERIDAAKYAELYKYTPDGKRRPAADLMDMLHEEAIGHALGDYAEGRGKPTTAIEMLFDRVKRFFQSIRNWMDGHNFSSAHDLFDTVINGDLAKRPVFGDIPGSGYSDAAIIKMLRDNKPDLPEDPMQHANAVASAAEGLANCMTA